MAVVLWLGGFAAFLLLWRLLTLPRHHGMSPTPEPRRSLPGGLNALMFTPAERRAVEDKFCRKCGCVRVAQFCAYCGGFCGFPDQSAVCLAMEREAKREQERSR